MSAILPEGIRPLLRRTAALAWLLTAAQALAAPAARPAPKVTFYRDIAPIVFKNCSPCHRPGESGPFPFLSYQDVKRRAQQIADVTSRRYMPPWLPETGYGDFAEERRLSDAQIRLIQDWVKQGSLPGPTAHAPQAPKFTEGWQLGTPDLVLHVTKPYGLYADGPEVFWNFIMPVPITTTRWVKAIEVRPGNLRVFHHANVIIDRSGSARKHEAQPGAGFPGMDLTVEEDTFDPDGHFLSWKPGSEPVVEPDGMAWRAEPGMDLVLNVHMRPSGKPEVVDPVIGLYFTEKPATKYPMLVQLEHDLAIDIPPGDKDFLVTDEFRVPLDLNVLAIYPHAGRSRADLDQLVAEFTGVFTNADGNLFVETYNQLNAYFATVPGNYALNLRQLYLLNTNYADLSFLFTILTGEKTNEHLGTEYLAVVETDNSTPYFLNLHTRDVAHTLILGMTGSGKTMIMLQILRQIKHRGDSAIVYDPAREFVKRFYDPKNGDLSGPRRPTSRARA